MSHYLQNEPDVLLLNPDGEQAAFKALQKAENIFSSNWKYFLALARFVASTERSPRREQRGNDHQQQR